MNDKTIIRQDNRRAFYTDPLAAAWMFHKHGVVIVDFEFHDVRHSFHAGRAGLLNANSYARGQEYRFYIHPDSMHLLEPQMDDDVKYIERHASNIASQGFATYHWMQQDEAFKQGKLEIQIIQRNGKAFHWPEFEA